MSTDSDIFESGIRSKKLICPDSGIDDHGVRSCHIVGTQSPDFENARSGVRDLKFIRTPVLLIAEFRVGARY